MDVFGNSLESERNKIISNLEKTNKIINDGLIRTTMRVDMHDKKIIISDKKLNEIDNLEKTNKIINEELIRTSMRVDMQDKKIIIVEEKLNEIDNLEQTDNIINDELIRTSMRVNMQDKKIIIVEEKLYKIDELLTDIIKKLTITESAIFQRIQIDKTLHQLDNNHRDSVRSKPD